MWMLSANGVNFLKGWEKFSSHPYLDNAGVPTIGYGTTRYADGTRVTMQDAPITEDKASLLLTFDCKNAINCLNKNVPTSVSLTQNQVDALIAFIYNVGVGGFTSSTILTTILSTGPKTVTKDMFTRWNKVHDPKTGQLIDSNGLTNRRTAEWNLYSA